MTTCPCCSLPYYSPSSFRPGRGSCLRCGLIGGAGRHTCDGCGALLLMSRAEMQREIQRGMATLRSTLERFAAETGATLEQTGVTPEVNHND